MSNLLKKTEIKSIIEKHAYDCRSTYIYTVHFQSLSASFVYDYTNGPSFSAQECIKSLMILQFLRWYRGIVLSMSDTEDTREVFFVDYGDTEWVPKACIQPIHPSLLQVLCINLLWH